MMSKSKQMMMLMINNKKMMKMRVNTKRVKMTNNLIKMMIMKMNKILS